MIAQSIAVDANSGVDVRCPIESDRIFYYGDLQDRVWDARPKPAFVSLLTLFFCERDDKWYKSFVRLYEDHVNNEVLSLGTGNPLISLLSYVHNPIRDVIQCQSTLDFSPSRAYIRVNFTTFTSNDDDIENLYVSPSIYEEIQTCQSCDTHVTNEYYEERGGYDDSRDEWVCDSCSDELSCCESCNITTNEANMRWRNDNQYCNSCYDDLPRFIHDYSYEPDYNWWDSKKPGELTRSFIVSPSGKIKNPSRTGKKFFGIELEVEVDSGDNQEIAADIVGSERILYCKHDGSLNDGFEVVSHPMTYNAFCNFDWEDRVLHHRGKLRGFRPSTTGMHVHISKSAFTDNHLLKFLSMIYEYKKFTHLIAQRTGFSQYNRWAKCKAGMLEISKQKMTKEIRERKGTTRFSDPYSTKLSWGDKYSMVNLRKQHTVEVRIFKSNLEEVSFRKNVEYCEALYNFTYILPHSELKLDSFLKYIESENKLYPNLNKFLLARPSELATTTQFPLGTPDGLELS